MRKLINSPDDFVDEVLDGILMAHPEQLRALPGAPRVLTRANEPGGKVGIVTGGGSGHLPVFLGYVGTGLCSAVAVGNVFSSPSAEEVLAATKAADTGRGVVYVIGNYGGDVLNFGLAADFASDDDGIETRTVLIHDDVLSAPAEAAATRRGVAGMFFAWKCAGAAAERGDSLDEVARIAGLAGERTRSVGVGLSPTILPAAGKPTFELPDGQMEIGIGIHGEPGSHRGPLESADEIADRMITAIVSDMPVEAGDELVLLVNGLGATPLEELYLLYRRSAALLAKRGARIHRPYVGEYATSLEMAGASVSVLKLTGELKPLIDAPASSPFFRQ
ncbi:MAG TPA: dihydroxyacetone kinase subunit DhaK [Streptosporangiaceae bacterium]|nr:dihydroxyacetone kinase subunit DhaK [Streptosporangiaceae bacterium]